MVAANSADEPMRGERGRRRWMEVGAEKFGRQDRAVAQEADV